MNTVKRRFLPTILAVLATLLVTSIAVVTEEAHAVTFPVAVDSTNFPDPVWREWVNTNCAGGDDELTEAEAEAVTFVDVYNRGISDLKGIEYFEKLTSLNCGSNSLATLDVSGNLATGSGGYESTYFMLPPDAAHSLSLASSDVSYDPVTGLFTTNTLAPVGFKTLLDGETYLSGTIYFEEVVTFDVIFIDWDGTVLFEQTVFPGANAIAPPDPVRPGYVFTGWDKSFMDVQGDLTVQATYKPVSAEGDGIPVPPASKLAPTSDSSTPVAALAAGLSLIAGIALAARASLSRRKS